MTSGIAKALSEIKEAVRKTGYSYIDSYIGKWNKTKLIIRDNDGYKYDVYLADLLRRNQIRIVDKRNPFTLSHNIPLWLKLNNSQFELLKDNEYKGALLNLKFYCNNCQDYPLMSWNNILNGQGCGICKGFQTGIYHNLEFQRPDIAKEWHPTKNGNLTPKDVTYGSGKKVWWLCPNDHEYQSRIADRTFGTGCSICSKTQKESKIASELKFYILNKHNAKEEYKIVRNPETKQYLPFDIYIFGGKDPKINGVYIEIHGEQHYKLSGWHKQKSHKNKTTPEEEFEYQKQKDKIKKNFAKKNGVYIEIDLRKIKTYEEVIMYVNKKLIDIIDT